MDEQSIISSCPRARRDTHQLPLRGIHHMKRGWRRHLSIQLKNPYPAEDSLETSPRGADLASSLGSRASKSFLNSVELDRCRSASLQSSLYVLLGGGRCARGADEDSVLLASVESGLVDQAVFPRKVRDDLLCRHTCPGVYRILIISFRLLEGKGGTYSGVRHTRRGACKGCIRVDRSSWMRRTCPEWLV